MSTGKITKTVIDRLPAGSQLWDTVVRGFGARRQRVDVFYLLRYRLHGKQRYATIGRHGSPWTPDTARVEARRLLGLIAAGTDPAQADKPAETFGVEIERYLTRQQPAFKPSSFIQTQRHLRQYAKPLHRHSLTEIGRRTIAVLLGELETGSGVVTRNRVRSSLSAFFTWTIREGLLETNPVTGTGKATETSRERVLTSAELARLWHNLGDDHFADVVRLLLLTGQRRDEIGKLRWSEITNDCIVLPPERTKNNRTQVVPLSPHARAIIDRQVRRNDRDFLFGVGAVGFTNWSDAKTALDKRLALAPWRLHDLRRTCATMMAELGVLPHIIEAVLNHVSGHKAGVAGVYNRARYEGEMREALTRWAQYVASLPMAGAPVPPLSKPPRGATTKPQPERPSVPVTERTPQLRLVPRTR